jgi:methylmalonyl-CoA/ethylmalonyl-CoA epimerase
MREPVFNETVQLGIVMRDLEATVRRYQDDYGIGPWEFAQIDAGDANNYREYGQPVERSARIAVATPNFDETVARAERENHVILSGEFSGARVAYLATERDLGVVLEVFSGTPDDEAP